MSISKRFVAKNGVDNSSLTLINVADPVNPQDAATKAFSSNANNLTTGTLASAILGNSTVYVGTTPLTLNRASGVQALTGISSIDGNAASASKLLAARTLVTTGDVTFSMSFDGTANVSTAATLSSTGVSAGTYNSVTVDTKGRVTAAANTTYLTANQAITITGDATATGTTSMVLTLATVNASPVSSAFHKVTTNGKGLVVATAAVGASDITTALGFTPYSILGGVVQGSVTATQFTGSGAGLTTIPNTALVNPQITVGTTNIALGAASTTLTGLTSVTSSQFVGTLTGSITGNAPTATTAGKLTTAQQISATGDASWTVSFDGSATASASLTLTNTGVAAGTFGTAAGQIPVFTVNAKGLITGVVNTPISSLPAGVSAPGLLISSASVGAWGTVQGSATLLTADLNTVTSATAGTSTGILLQVGTPGRCVTVVNRSGTAITVYPNVSAAIDSLAINVGIVIANNTHVDFTALDATHWTSSLQKAISGANLASGTVAVAALASNGIVVGTTGIALGQTTTTLTGLTSVTATTFTGALTGNAATSSQASTVSIAADASASGLYSMMLAPTNGVSGAYLPKMKAGLTYDTTNLALNIPGVVYQTSSHFVSATTNNQLMQVSTNSLASGLGMWAGGSSAIYSTGSLSFMTGVTLGALPGIPTGGVTGMTLTSVGRLGLNNANPSYLLDVGGTARATAFIGDGSGLTGVSATVASAPLLQAVTSGQSTNYAPGAVSTGLHYDFKANTTDGLVDEPGTGAVGYHGVITAQQWSDASGGTVNQLGLSGAGNMWIRAGIPVNGSVGSGYSSWTAWRKFALLNSDNTIQVTHNGAAGSVNLAVFNSPSNGSQLVIATSNSNGALLSGTSPGDSILRAETNSLRIGTSNPGGIVAFGNQSTMYGYFGSGGLTLNIPLIRAAAQLTDTAIPIVGLPSEGTYMGYLLLARAYTTGSVADSSAVGRIVSRRGGTTSSNRVDIYDVVSKTGYQSDHLFVKVTAGSNSWFQRTVLATYGGVVYHAIETTTTGGGPGAITFTGAAVNCSLTLVDASFVSAVSAYGRYEIADGTTGNKYNSGNLLAAGRVVASATGTDPGWGASGDLVANRGNGTGVVYIGSASTYMYFDGTKYNMPNAPLYVNGNLGMTGIATDQHGTTQNNVCRTYATDSTNDFNALTDYSRVGSISASANTPFGNDWYTVYNARHRGGAADGSTWGSQIAIGMTNTDYSKRIAFRSQLSPAWNAWTEILSTYNYASYAVPKVGNSTITGTITINPGSGSYNEGIRIMTSADSYAGIFLGTDSSGSGSMANQINLLRNPSGNFEVRAGGSGISLFTSQGNGAGTAFTASVSGDRVYAGFDSGVAGSVSASAWFRSSGATGWYNTTYTVGAWWAAVGTNGTNSFSHGSVASYGTTGSYSGFSCGGQIVFMSNVPAAGNSGNWGIYNDITSTWMMLSDSSGNVTFNGNVTAYSDRRLKKDIVPILNARRRLLDTITGVQYTRIDTDEVELGVIAQEVQTEFDVLVHETKNDADNSEHTVLSVNYNGLIAPLIEVAREFDTEIETLKTKLAYEVARREQAEARLTRLEQLMDELMKK